MIVKQLKFVSCKCFADDTILYASDKDSSVIEQKINYDLVKIEEWLQRNSLRLNTNKTKFMITHDERKEYIRNNCDMKVSGVRIEEIREIKYLGVIIDENISFNKF